MDPLGLFGIIGGTASNARIVKAGTIQNDIAQRSTVSISISWDYGVITSGFSKSGNNFQIILFPLFFAPGMTEVYGSCIYTDTEATIKCDSAALFTSVTTSSLSVNGYVRFSYILLSLS